MNHNIYNYPTCFFQCVLVLCVRICQSISLFLQQYSIPGHRGTCHDLGESSAIDKLKVTANVSLL